MILMTGATGTVGRPLVGLLRIAGAEVRAVSRDPAGAALPRGVEVVGADPSRPDTVAAALDGVTALFLHPRAVGDAAAELAALARRRGVRRIVALSATNVDDDLSEQPSRFAGDRNREAEEAAAGSGSLTHAEMVGVIGDVLGRPLRYEELAARDAVERLTAHGLPEPFAVALIARYARLAGTPQPVSNDVEKILGRPARTFAQWVQDHAAAFTAGTEHR